MRPIHFIPLLTLAGLAARAPAQGVKVSLTALSPIAIVGDKVDLTLDVEVTADQTEIPAAFLWGIELSVQAGDAAAKTIRPEGDPPAAKAKAGKGAKLTRTIQVAAGNATGTVKFGVAGYSGAEATVRVIENAKDTPLDQLDLAKTHVLLVTNFGNMEVEFFPTKAPRHAANFIKLSQSGFYDGTRFHRVIKGFMIQGGDPNTKNDDPRDDGAGNPGYTIEAEFNDTPHDKGILSMARTPDPNSAGCQFFVVHGRAQHLDRQYTAFGNVVAGLETLDRICDVPVGRNPNGEVSMPTQDIWLKKAIVIPVKKAAAPQSQPAK